MAARMERRVRSIARGNAMKRWIVALALCLPFALWAQAWPTAKPITLIVPFTPGGNVDFAARLFATRLQQALKQSVLVENVAGAGGIVGVQKAVQAPPDGNQLDLAMLVTVATLPQVKAGKVKAIAITTPQRLASAPEIPTLAETSALKRFDMVAWTGLFAPAKTPPAIVERLAKELDQALSSPDVGGKFEEQGALLRRYT